ncbi:MAG: Methyltransferase type 11 [Parcubacteria group bacterium]|nr:Methyltransferase type 11 [Parcubacteria group bacterium]
MNENFATHTLRGKVIDVGGGRNPDYFTYFNKDENVTIEAQDGSMSGIDFERDPLPYAPGTIDTIVLANVLEHIYDHQFLLREIRTTLKPAGELIGFVPFWIGYHPDPHDYFRYTKEALQRMLTDAGFMNISITPIGAGPIRANFNTIALSFPRILRPLLYLPYAILDQLFITLRPNTLERNPLGFVFTAQSHA